MTGQCLQRPDLGVGTAHLRNARRQRAELADRRDRAMPKVRLRDARVGVGTCHQRLQRPRVSLLASKTCANGGMRGVVGAGPVRRVLVEAVELMLVVQRADEIDVCGAGAVARQQIAEQAHQFRPVLRRRSAIRDRCASPSMRARSAAGSASRA